MSTTPTPTPATPPTTSRLNQILNDILMYSEIVTEVAAAVPSPVSGLAAIALKFEQIAQAGLAGLAASKGQTVEQVIAQLKQEAPV